MNKICNFIIKYAFYGLVFLMPLFWLPWTVEIHEFNKQYLLVFLVGLALLAWLTKMTVVRKRLSLIRTPLDIWVLAFMLVMVLSALFSIDKISSWLGFYGRFSDSMIGLLALGVMYFVVVNNFRVKKSISQQNYVDTGTIGLRAGGLSLEKILRLFLTASWLVVIIAYFAVSGLWSKIPGLPLKMSFRSFNSVSSSLEGLSIFLVVVIGLVVGTLLLWREGKREVSGWVRFLHSAWKKLGRVVKKSKLRGLAKIKGFPELSDKWLALIDPIGLLLITIVLLIIINFRPAWLVLGITMLILLVVAIWRRMFRERVNLLLLPIILLAISLVFWSGLPSKVESLGNLTSLETPLPQEVILDYQTAETVTWQTFKEYPILGSGPGTFLADFTKLKPIEFNQTGFWNVRFDKGPSHLMEIIGTTGLLGLLSYLLVVVSILLLIGSSFFSKKGLTALRGSYPISVGQPISVIFFPLILAWLSLFLAQFVYLQNTVLSFYFWFFTALIVVLWQRIEDKPLKKISFSFKKLPEVGLIMNILLLILVFVLASLFYLGGRFYRADTYFERSIVDDEQIVGNLEKAVNLNKYRESYRQRLSQVYLINAWAELNKSEGERNLALLQAYAAGAIQQARLATQLGLYLVSTWENLGIIYRDSQGLVGGTLPFALESFTKAAELEPTNPFFFRERCRLNLISEDRDWDETIGYCQKAVDLKSDFLDAHIQLALAYEQKGDLEEAYKQLRGTLDKLKGMSFQRGSQLAGAAAEIYFQLGRVHFNLNQINEAVRMFEQSVIVIPEYANARYALALSYQAQGRVEDALIQLQIVNQLVPGNEEILARIQQLSGQLTPSTEE